MRFIPGIHHNRRLLVLRRTCEFGMRVVVGIAVAASAAPVYAAGRGDSDEDGDIDLRDFANLQMCIPEPGDPPPFGDCLVFDFNGDEVVDQADFEAMYRTLLGPGVVPPRITDTAVVLGRVLIAVPEGEEEVPLEGARITAAPFCEECEEEADLPPVAFSDAQGNFRYQTVPFEGQGDFLLRIRKDGYAENLRRITILAGRCQRAHDAYLNEARARIGRRFFRGCSTSRTFSTSCPATSVGASGGSRNSSSPKPSKRRKSRTWRSNFRPSFRPP